MDLEPRIESFRQKALGLFVHYGAYIQYESGEWALNLCNIDPKQYERNALSLDYSSFDPQNIIKAAKVCGAKYITFTTRHHDGFSLYDTRGLSDYDIMHTPNGRDLVKEFCDACHENGIMPFLYHTTLDWHHPDFKADFIRYQQYLRDSIEILCRNYGEIGGFWLDGNWSMPADAWDLDGLYGIIRKYQPNAIIINNTGLDEPGVLGHREIDCVTFEQGIPTKPDCKAGEKAYMGEMCYPLCEHWGIAEDINLKSMRQILEAFTSCRKVGGNLLLGIFTNLDGSQPLLHYGFLEALGRWVHQNERAVYLPAPGETQGNGKDFWLECGSKAYAFVHNVGTWGDSNVMKVSSQNAVCFTGLSSRILEGHWLNNGEPVRYDQDLDRRTLTLDPGHFRYGESWIVRVAEFTLADS